MLDFHRGWGGGDGEVEVCQYQMVHGRDVEYNVSLMMLEEGSFLCKEMYFFNIRGTVQILNKI